MSAPRSFHTSGNPTRRSPLSSKAGWPADEADYSSTGYGQQRGLGSILPTAKPQPRTVPIDPLAELRKLVRVLVPTCKLRVSVSEDEDGIAPLTRLYKIECYGPEVGAAVVCGQGATPSEATHDLRAKWARARRAYAVEKLVHECQRLAGEAFTPAARQKLEAEMSTCRYADYERKAARWRTAAQGHATSHQAA